MAYKVYVDGQEGTTGLQINEYLGRRTDIELLKIDPSLRKDPGERARLLNAADVAFLCLPDAAARERVLEQARAVYGPAHVLAHLTVDARSGAPSWVDHLPTVLPVLEQMQGVRSVMIDGRFLVLSGVVTSDQEKAVILRTIAPLRSLGLELEDHMTVAGAGPCRWTSARPTGSTRGSVPPCRSPPGCCRCPTAGSCPPTPTRATRTYPPRPRAPRCTRR